MQKILPSSSNFISCCFLTELTLSLEGLFPVSQDPSDLQEIMQDLCPNKPLQKAGGTAAPVCKEAGKTAAPVPKEAGKTAAPVPAAMEVDSEEAEEAESEAESEKTGDSDISISEQSDHSEEDSPLVKIISEVERQRVDYTLRTVLVTRKVTETARKLAEAQARHEAVLAEAQALQEVVSAEQRKMEEVQARHEVVLAEQRKLKEEVNGFKRQVDIAMKALDQPMESVLHGVKSGGVKKPVKRIAKKQQRAIEIPTDFSNVPVAVWATKDEDTPAVEGAFDLKLYWKVVGKKKKCLAECVRYEDDKGRVTMVKPSDFEDLGQRGKHNRWRTSIRVLEDTSNVCYKASYPIEALLDWCEENKKKVLA